MKSPPVPYVRRTDEGFTLIEVLIAMLLLVCVAVGIARLFALAIVSTQAARHQTSTTALAAQKIEQLRSLTWSVDESTGARISDMTTDLSSEPPTSTGRGLAASPSGTVVTSTTGYVDYLDANGRWVGNGTTVPGRAVFIRRWNVAPIAADPDNTLLLQVLVTTIKRDAQASSMGAARMPLGDDTWLTTVRTRKVRVS